MNGMLLGFSDMEPVGIFLIGLLIFLVVFLIIRELLCWYWKLNHIVGLLEDIKLSLEKKENRLSEE